MQGADIVVHAAAMKQVPACEYNPFEAVQTNVLGAQHIVDAAIDTGVTPGGRPVHRQGRQPRQPLRRHQALRGEDHRPGQRLRRRFGHGARCVRYGNVVGSRGSVVPLFRKQRLEGRLTITDERMTRFWITLAQAVDLVHVRPRAQRRRRGLHPQDPVDDGHRPGRGHGARRCPSRSSASGPARSSTRSSSPTTRAGTPSTPATCTSCCPSTPGGQTHPRWVAGKPLHGRIHLRERHQRRVARPRRAPTSSS